MIDEFDIIDREDPTVVKDERDLVAAASDTLDHATNTIIVRGHARDALANQVARGRQLILEHDALQVLGQLHIALD